MHASALRSLLDVPAVALYDFWLTYWSYGGNAGILEFEAFIYGVLKPTEMDLYLLECAVRDTLAAADGPMYWRPIGGHKHARLTGGLSAPDRRNTAVSIRVLALDPVWCPR